MKRNFISLLVLIIATQFCFGGSVTEPANLPAYYSTLNNTSAKNLFDAVHTVAKKNYSSLSYAGLWTAYATTDVYPSGHIYEGKIWDMYGGCEFTYGASKNGGDQCGSYSAECDCYNREHSIPKSWFGSSESANTPGTDIFHVVPTDGKVNGMRSNYAFGEVNSATYTYNGSKLGTPKNITVSNTLLGDGEVSKSCGSSPVFEPIDEYKGDFARGYFGAMVRWANGDYQAFTSGDGGQIFNTAYDASHYYGLTQYGLALLLKWHRQDPVSQKEIDRNNGIQATQGNRNPFIDYPILVEYIWGEKKGQSFDVSNAVGSFETAFVPGVSDGSKDGGGVDPLDPDYYAPVEGLKDSLLKSKLAEVTWSHYTKRYSYGSGKNNTWDAFWYTDRNEADNSVVDMYSNNKRYFNPSDMTASVADCDIEHMFPNSWFGAKAGNAHAYCDLHHLVPSDYSANRSKSNRGPGVPTDTTFNNGVWVNGKDANRDNLEVFCPSDEYKGDFARAFFYIAMAYGDTAVWQAEALPNHMTNSDWHEFLPQTRDLLLEWHRNDPVSEKERVRMNTVYELQGNRNPFIDYPCLAEYIWGVRQGEAFNLDCSDTPVPPTKYTITWSVDGKKSTSEVTKGLRPSAPSVTNCSESRVFVGWTASSTVSDKPAELYTAATIPAATKATTYYAVYADKETEDGGGDFALYKGELTEGDYVIYYNGKAMKAEVASSRLGYAEVIVSADKIAPEDASIIWHLAQTDGYWRIYNAGVNSYAAGTETKNQAQLLEDGTDDKSQWKVSGTATYDFVNKANAAGGVNATLRNNGTYGFACYATATGGALSLYKQSGKVTYTNYGLSCSTAKKVTITYHSNDGKDQTLVQETLQNSETQLDANTFVRAHYSFEGWSLSASGSKAYDDESMIVPAGDVDLYAVWKEDPKYTLTFRNGEAVYMSLTDYAGEAVGEITDPESCERYSFVGWSTTQYPADNTEEPVTGTPTIMPEVNQIYYAVYEQEVNIPGTAGVPVGTTLWAEDFSGYAAGDAPSTAVNSSHTGTTVYGENSVTYTCKNGGSDTKIYNDTYAKGEKPEIMIAKGDGAFSVSGIPTGGAKEMTLSFKVNKTQISYCGVSSPTEGIQIGTQTIAGGEYTCVITNEQGVAFFDIVITNSNSGTNGREDDFLLLIKTAGGTPDVHITYYTTAPDCSPVIIPKYTVTFMNGDEKHDEIIGQAGEGIFVYDPTPTCEQYTFYGWSENQYSADNTLKPVVFVPTVIPNEDKTYYAVYTKTADAGIGLTNQYKKITREDELTNANYLVVADTSKLLAMSTDWKNSYYLGSVEVTENDGVITTDNSKIVWNISRSEAGLSFENSEKGYLYIEQSINGEKTYYNIKLGTNTTANKFSCEVNDGVWVFSSVTYPDRQIEYYKAKAYWSYFSGQDAPIYLYKQQEGVIHKTYYSTTLDCSEGPSTELESEEVRVTARKMLINGQMYIVLGDRVYDVTGQRVR